MKKYEYDTHVDSHGLLRSKFLYIDLYIVVPSFHSEKFPSIKVSRKSLV